jgi:hypothetical protein
MAIVSGSAALPAPEKPQETVNRVASAQVMLSDVFFGSHLDIAIILIQQVGGFNRSRMIRLRCDRAIGPPKNEQRTPPKMLNPRWFSSLQKDSAEIIVKLLGADRSGERMRSGTSSFIYSVS